MATSIGQCAPVFLPGEPPSLTENPSRPQSTGSQRMRHYQSGPARTDTGLLLPVAALPQRPLNVKVVQLLGLWGPWWCQVCRDMHCLHSRSYGLIRVFSQASYSWQSEGLFGQSFSITPPVQALRGLPCLGSFSVVQLEGPPWLGSYSVVWHISNLKEHPGWGPTL